jgi:hypothetical protein
MCTCCLQGIGGVSSTAEADHYSKQFEVRTSPPPLEPPTYLLTAEAAHVHNGSSRLQKRCTQVAAAAWDLRFLLCPLPCLQRHRAIEELQSNLREEYRAVFEFEVAFKHTVGWRSGIALITKRQHASAASARVHPRTQLCNA